MVAALSALGATGTVVTKLVSERLGACNSLAFNGCHVTYTLELSTAAAVPGGPLAVTATVRTTDGRPAAQVPVTFEYPGQADAFVDTDDHGRASTTFAQRATTDAVDAEVREPGPWLSSATSVAKTRSTPVPIAPNYPAAVQTLLHRQGAYAVPTEAAAEQAIAAHFTLLESDSGDVGLAALAEREGAEVIDGRIGGIVRSELCEQDACHAPTPGELDDIAAQVKAVIRSPAGRSPATAAWQLLPRDLTGPIAPALERVRQTLTESGDQRPTICSFTLPVVRPGDTDGAAAAVSAFTAAASNFNPQWCSAVAIAAVPMNATPDFDTTSYDWSQRTVLGPALASLRHAGWDPGTQPFFVIPAAFSWKPKVDAMGEHFSPTPTRLSLGASINTFCQTGASTVIAYAWDDGARGPVATSVRGLGNTPFLRTFVRTATRHCGIYWKAAAR